MCAAAYADQKLLDTVYAIILRKLHANNSDERSAALNLIHNLPPLCRDWMKLQRFSEKNNTNPVRQQVVEAAEFKLRTNDFKNFCDVLINITTGMR